MISKVDLHANLPFIMNGDFLKLFLITIWNGIEIVLVVYLSLLPEQLLALGWEWG